VSRFVRSSIDAKVIIFVKEEINPCRNWLQETEIGECKMFEARNKNLKDKEI
jgi:hypothetical protein